MASAFWADWETATTAATNATRVAGVHAAPVPKPRLSSTVLRAPECDPVSHAISSGTATMARASTRVMKAAHPSALTAT